MRVLAKKRAPHALDIAKNTKVQLPLRGMKFKKCNQDLLELSLKILNENSVTEESNCCS